MKRLVLARGHGRVRALIREPIRAAREGHRFMQMASPNATRWVGFVEHSDQGTDRRHGEHFEQVWALSRAQPEMRPTVRRG